MAKGPQGQQAAPKTKGLPASHTVHVTREATGEAAGNLGDKITRAPKTRKKSKAKGG